MTQHRRTLFDTVSIGSPELPTVTTVGTFDSRKGAADFPSIVREIVRAVSGVRFRFLGTSRVERDVLSYFDNRLRDRIEITPRYDPEELPELLAQCSVGVFPSYVEGFGLGVLEMLAASIPVIAYNSPGPPMMLPPEYLVPPGHWQKMAEKVISLMNDRDSLARARAWAKERSRQFCWDEIAKQTDRVYRDYLDRKRAPYQHETARSSCRSN